MTQISKSIPMCTARQIGWLINVKVDFDPNRYIAVSLSLLGVETNGKLH